MIMNHHPRIPSKSNQIVRSALQQEDCFIVCFRLDEIHLLQTESKEEYDGWFLALKRTAYSRIGGGKFQQSDKAFFFEKKTG